MRTTFPGTKSIPWISLGTIDKTAADADATLTATERNFQSVKDLANAVWFFVPSAISDIEMRFLLATANADVDIEVWTGKLARDPSIHPTEDCNLQRRGTLDVICGAQKDYRSAKLFADTTAAVANDGTVLGWNDGVSAADYMMTWGFDLRGDNIIVFHGIGTVAFDEDCEVEVTGYS